MNDDDGKHEGLTRRKSVNGHRLPMSHLSRRGDKRVEMGHQPQRGRSPLISSHRDVHSVRTYVPPPHSDFPLRIWVGGSGVCMYVCTYVCMYVCTYVRTYRCMAVRTYGHTDVRMYVCTYVWTDGHTDGRTAGRTYGHTDVRMYGRTE
jgi:hypothetical protein